MQAQSISARHRPYQALRSPDLTIVDFGTARGMPSFSPGTASGFYLRQIPCVPCFMWDGLESGTFTHLFKIANRRG